jgi:tetratricopeptide (TPR) repeat protein
VHAHSDAKNHAWLWIYRNDGTIYWLDPTWTDNSGYLWWGIVRNGEETQVRPSAEYCMVTLPNNAAFDDLNQGYANYQYEMTDLSIADYTAVLRNDPNNVLALSNRGVAYADIGDFDQAFPDCNRAINLAPNSAYVYYNRGLAYSYMSRENYYDHAIADFTQAINLAPDLSFAYYHRGGMYAMKSDYDRAIADYTQAIRLNPNFAGAYTGRGSVYRRKRDYNQAITDIEMALRINPNDAFTKTFLEMVRRDRGW